jgi:U11/U12 small nuclear ribonucleoprotein 65 kDa protein
MNKMNLPAPFRMALPTPPLPSQVPVIPHPQPPPGSTTTGELHSADLSSDESELESSDVLATSVFLFNLVVSLLNYSCTFYLPQEDIDKRKIKRAKHEAIVGPAVDKNVAHEAVGVKSVALVSNELQVIKKKNPVLQVDYTLFVDYSLVEKSSLLNFFLLMQRFSSDKNYP